MTTWCGKVPVRDDFGKLIVASFIDGATKQGPWAIMTRESHALYGVGLGLGKGQLYQRNEEGAWVKQEEKAQDEELPPTHVHVEGEDDGY